MEKESWIEGKKKLIATLIGMAVSVAVAFGISQTKVDSIVQIVSILTPVLLSVIYDIYNQQAAKGKAATEITKLEIETRRDIEVAKASVPSPNGVASAPTVVSNPATWAFPMYFPKDWAAYRQEIKAKIDRDYAGVKDVSLTSDNPSLVWSESQKQAMSIETPSNQAVIEFHKQILLPAAQAALVDQKQQLEGKRCQWPPSIMAEQWVLWCEEHIKAMEDIIAANSYDFSGFNVWEAGEVAKAWVIDKITWITTYKNGQPKDWKYPEKPEGYEFR